MKLYEKIKENRKITIVVVFVAFLAIFLRTYKLHDWLIFNLDQIRDAKLVEQVLNKEIAWPLLGPTMNHTDFHLGPVYYYFQIISAKLFGLKPEVLAFPDLFFSVLSIPLFYYFLRRYFDLKISTSLVSLYAFSYYAITYSRFAWNPNSIPFFILLFLLSMHELICNKEKTKLFWIILAGISLGVAVQLHAILIVLLPIFSVVVFYFLIKHNRALFNKCLIIILVAIFLNLGQIINELRTNFSNSKSFISSLTEKTENKKNNLAKKISMDLECHIQSNFLIPSSIGNKNDCDFIYTKKLFSTKLTGSMKKKDNSEYLLITIIATVFSLLGYGMIGYFYKKENDMKKRYFLSLLGFYAVLSILVLLPIGKDLRPRYFLHIFFVPYIFIGLFFMYLKNKHKKFANLFLVGVFIFFAITNFISIKKQAQILLNQSATKLDSGYDSIVLGETESMVNFIILNSEPNKFAQISGKATYIGTFYEALLYIANRKYFHILSVKKDDLDTYQNVPLFLLANSNAQNKYLIENEKDTVVNFKMFGEVGIYQIKQ